MISEANFPCSLSPSWTYSNLFSCKKAFEVVHLTPSTSMELLIEMSQLQLHPAVGSMNETRLLWLVTWRENSLNLPRSGGSDPAEWWAAGWATWAMLWPGIRAADEWIRSTSRRTRIRLKYFQILIRFRGAMVARLTPDQKVACSSHVGITNFMVNQLT